ncbi:MAG: hypothetical protein LM601_09245 [Candidatus Verstraetearchaeota archaeon]|nr:hypothetical protein [Candidatus Verstraetearchaeota archaeon]
MWSCLREEKCPQNRKEFCGINSGKPKIISYHIEYDERERKREECYLEHVILCYEEWQKKKRRFINSLIRRFAVFCKIEVNNDLIADIENGLRIIIAHHDIGKLSYEYRKGEWYRHEIISAHIVHDILLNSLPRRLYKDLLSAILSAATYLHHEALQLSRKWFELRSPTFDYLTSKIGDKSFTFGEGSYQFFEATNAIYNLNNVIRNYSLPEKVSGEEIVETIGNFISSLDSASNINAARLCLASIVLLINEIDNEAAEKGRSYATI